MAHILAHRSLTLLFASLMASFAISSSDAANVSFVPGDAFFHAVLAPREIVESFSSAGTVRLVYAPPSHEVPNFGGFLGLCNLDIEVSEPLSRTKLASVLESDSANSKPLSVFVYNKDFDLRRDRLCLKYNEEWRPRHSTNPVQVKLRRSIGYSSFVRTYEAVVEDWGNAAEVPGLKVEGELEKATLLLGESIASPAKTRLADVMIAVLLAGDHTSCFERRGNVRVLLLHEGKLESLRFADRQPVIETVK
ncbi:MAG: hypothetical protein KF777_07985 [Planctomycetaceae bacterium]|nr:hypothetical protein [Planctomycetaceae bacterium]